MFVGWGQQPYFTEFNAAGKQMFDARFTSNTSSYRAYRFPWTGQPTTPPSIAAGANNDTTTEVWASWNGATTVSSWRVLAGPSAGSLTTLQTVGRNGFETGISALDRRAVLRRSGARLQRSGTRHLDARRVLGRTSVSRAVARSCPPQAGPAPCRRCATTRRPATSRSRSRSDARWSLAPGARRSRPTAAGSSTSRSTAPAVRCSPTPSGRRLLVYMTGQDISKLSFARFITLVPFSTRGSAPARGASQSSTLRILGLTDFVSSGGVGGLLAECLGTSTLPRAVRPCGG